MSFKATRPYGACTVCASQANILQAEFSVGEVVDCSRCGDYRVSRLVADNVGLPFRDQKMLALASHTIRKMQTAGERRPLLTMDFFHALESRSLPTPAEASDNLIQWFGNAADGRPGIPLDLNYTDPVLLSTIGVVDANDVNWIVGSLVQQQMFECKIRTLTTATEVYLTAKGWKRFEDLRLAHISSRFAFFARQFNNPDLDRLFDTCLAKAVRDTGYELRIATQRAGLIDAVIEDEIRRCRFVVADLSNKNDGAYWEAGFAEGLGKPVIYICRAADESGKEVAVHFDANHRNTVKWDLAAPESFVTRLKAVIRNTLLGDANQSD
jgi:hypothetical protein